MVIERDCAQTPQKYSRAADFHRQSGVGLDNGASRIQDRDIEGFRDVIAGRIGYGEVEPVACRSITAMVILDASVVDIALGEAVSHRAVDDENAVCRRRHVVGNLSRTADSST